MYALIGELSPSSSQEFNDRTQGAPIIFTHAYAYLSKSMSEFSLNEDVPEKVSLRFNGRFKNVYNAALGVSEFVGLLEDVRDGDGVTYWATPDFLPYFKFVNEPLRSKNAKNFCYALSNAMKDVIFDFYPVAKTSGESPVRVLPGMYSEHLTPSHLNMVEEYNPEVFNVFNEVRF